jgi:hypothetical protein
VAAKSVEDEGGDVGGSHVDDEGGVGDKFLERGKEGGGGGGGKGGVGGTGKGGGGGEGGTVPEARRTSRNDSCGCLRKMLQFCAWEQRRPKAALQEAHR